MDGENRHYSRSGTPGIPLSPEVVPAMPGMKREACHYEARLARQRVLSGICFVFRVDHHIAADKVPGRSLLA